MRPSHKATGASFAHHDVPTGRPHYGPSGCAPWTVTVRRKGRQVLAQVDGYHSIKRMVLHWQKQQLMMPLRRLWARMLSMFTAHAA